MIFRDGKIVQRVELDVTPNFLRNSRKTECGQQNTRRLPEVVHWRTSTRRRPDGWRAGQFLARVAVRAASFALARTRRRRENATWPE